MNDRDLEYYGIRFDPYLLDLEEDLYWYDKPNTKGRKKPQQMRQAKARTKALIKKLNHTHTPQGLG